MPDLDPLPFPFATESVIFARLSGRAICARFSFLVKSWEVQRLKRTEPFRLKGSPSGNPAAAYPGSTPLYQIEKHPLFSSVQDKEGEQGGTCTPIWKN